MTGSKGLVLFGSTGSIGTQVLDVVCAQSERYHVVGLTAHSNDELLAEQTLTFQPRFVAMSDDAARERLVIRLERHDVRIPVVGDEDLPSMLSRVAFDMPVVAAASTDLAQVVYDLLRLGMPMAIASKELLIMLGDLLEPFRTQLRPVDSELSAIWQCLAGEDLESVERVILTASGGPFRDTAAAALGDVTAAQALQHPSWRMGRKVTIDSATMFNKALELAETHVLFGLERERITAVQHPQSVVHGLVEFYDGTTRAIAYRPDMRVAIAYALSAPDRPLREQAVRLHLEELGQLTFEPVDAKFEAFAVGREADMRSPRSMLALLGADEVAVSRFLVAQGTFGDIVAALRHVLGETGDEPLGPSVRARIEAVSRGRQLAEEWYEKRYGTQPGDREGV
ncbi:MAG TPA: 1-deoxy-D-xylulose-5-phosphate reductoisomerase [Clostridia bacterium]|nr:1-deoxy-D-xylulose-5-phosphate reductoisomerase [Clostridia bacterium]